MGDGGILSDDENRIVEHSAKNEKLTRDDFEEGAA